MSDRRRLDTVQVHQERSAFGLRLSPKRERPALDVGNATMWLQQLVWYPVRNGFPKLQPPVDARGRLSLGL